MSIRIFTVIAPAMMAATLIVTASDAHADLVRIAFTGVNSSPNAANVFGTPVPTISG